jgi:hypothetical protein
MSNLAQAPPITAANFETSWPHKQFAFDQLVWHEGITLGREQPGSRVFVEIYSKRYPLFHNTTRLVATRQNYEEVSGNIRQYLINGTKWAIRCVMFDLKAENANSMFQRAIALIPGPSTAQKTDPIETFRKNWVSHIQIGQYST